MDKSTSLNKKSYLPTIAADDWPGLLLSASCDRAQGLTTILPDCGIGVALNKQTAENQRFLRSHPIDEATSLNKISALMIEMAWKA